MPAAFFASAFAVVALAVVPVVHGQDVSATASVTDTNVELGEPVEYQIQVSGGQPERTPSPPQVDGLSIGYVGESTSVQASNAGGGGFRFTSTRTYNFTVDATRAGRFVIPGQELTVGSTTVRVSPVAFNVTGSANAATAGRSADVAAFVRLIIPKKTAYVGEAIPAEVRCYFGPRLRADPDTNPILNGEGFSVQKFTAPQIDTEILEGSEFNIYRYKTALTGLKTGEITLGPVELTPNVQRPLPPSRMRQRTLNIFRSPFGNDPFAAMSNTITRPEKLQSEPEKIEIKPLPAGAPDSFNGAIGQFKLDAEVQGSPRKVQAGDPVTLRVSLRGQGNFDRIPAPALTDDNGLQTYPASAKFKGDDEVRFRGTKTFEQVVIPRGARNSLPGYQFAYLDPGTGKYVTLETPPIALKVEGGSTAAPSPATGQGTAGGPVPGPSAAKPTPTPRPEDILYIRNDPGKVVSGEAFVPLFRRRIFWLAQLVPLAGLLGLAALTWRNAHARDAARLRAADRQRLQGELVRTLQGEQTGRRDFYTAATRLARLKAAGTVIDDSSTLSAAEVSRAKSLDPDTASSLEEIFHRYDELSYSGARTAQEPVPVHERRDVLATVDKL